VFIMSTILKPCVQFDLPYYMLHAYTFFTKRMVSFGFSVTTILTINCISA